MPAQAADAGKGAVLVVMTNGGRISACGVGSRFGGLHVALDLPEAVAGLDAPTLISRLRGDNLRANLGETALFGAVLVPPSTPAMRATRWRGCKPCRAAPGAKS